VKRISRPSDAQAAPGPDDDQERGEPSTDKTGIGGFNEPPFMTRGFLAVPH
jgi:hypothetical protein